MSAFNEVEYRKKLLKTWKRNVSRGSLISEAPSIRPCYFLMMNLLKQRKGEEITAGFCPITNANKVKHMDRLGGFIRAAFTLADFKHAFDFHHTHPSRYEEGGWLPVDLRMLLEECPFIDHDLSENERLKELDILIGHLKPGIEEALNLANTLWANSPLRNKG